jgi:lia operon protein LiaF
MRSRRQLIFGSLVLLLGLILLLSNIFDVNLGVICWPSILILIGVWMLARPRMTAPGPGLKILFLGDIRRSGDWQLANEEFLTFIGDLRLDMSAATIPDGETRLSVYGFIGEITLIIPEHVGVSVSSIGFVSTTRLWTGKRESFLVPIDEISEGYAEAKSKVHIETYCFISELKVKRV